jgi:hypothetical protein
MKVALFYTQYLSESSTFLHDKTSDTEYCQTYLFF